VHHELKGGKPNRYAAQYYFNERPHRIDLGVTGRPLAHPIGKKFHPALRTRQAGRLRQDLVIIGATFHQLSGNLVDLGSMVQDTLAGGLCSPVPHCGRDRLQGQFMVNEHVLAPLDTGID
jgi:hypothetical protein